MATVFTYLADLLLMTASLGAAAYCMILSRRLTRLGSFDKGIGSAIAVLSAQVEEMKTALGEVKAGSDGAGQQLNDLVGQAREISAELEMMIAACHDFAETAIDVQTAHAARTRDTEPSAVAPEAEAAADRALAGRIMADGRSRTGGETATAVSPGTPVFGSRRSQPQHDDTVPMFRHRSEARG